VGEVAACCGNRTRGVGLSAVGERVTQGWFDAVSATGMQVELLARTGLRPSEPFNIRWNDIEVENCQANTTQSFSRCHQPIQVGVANHLTATKSAADLNLGKGVDLLGIRPETLVWKRGEVALF